MQIIQQCLVFLSFIFMVLSQDCLNKDGQEVDWWFILKMPSSTKYEWSGFDYFYCNNKNNCDDFNIQQDDLDSKTSPLMQTIKTIKFTDTNVVTMLWNDQPYENVQYPKNAHSKGIMQASLNGNNKAYIISHSSPKFPKLNDEGEIDDIVDTNFLKHGQHFLCLSTTTRDINKDLVDLYLEAEISIYKISSTPTKTSKFNEYEKLIELWNSRKPSKGSTPYTYKKSTELNQKLTFNTRAGQSFDIFSKNENFEKDFFAEVIAPNLHQDLIMESWVRQYKKSGLEDPECVKEFKTLSNEVVQYQGKKKDIDMTFTYKYTKDHSKYGITLPKDSESSLGGISFITTEYHCVEGQISESNQNSQKREQYISFGEEKSSDDDTTMEDYHCKIEKEINTKSKRYDDPGVPSRKKKVIYEKYVCFSDLNRQRSQWERGGLVYCFYNEGLWKHINQAFIKKQECKDDD